MIERTRVVLVCGLLGACASHTTHQPAGTKQRETSHVTQEHPTPPAADPLASAMQAPAALAGTAGHAGADGSAGADEDGGMAGSAGSTGAGAAGAPSAKPSSNTPVMVAGGANAAPVACTSDTDCTQSANYDTLWRPVCDRASSTCGPCATQAEENVMATRVIECLTLMPLQGCTGDCLIRMCHRPCVEAAGGGSAGATGALAPNTEWLGGGKPVPCTSDDDCRKSLFTPVCGASSQLCEVCPDPEQERALALRVNACILAASPRCLDDEDCRFAGCITSCEGP